MTNSPSGTYYPKRTLPAAIILMVLGLLAYANTFNSPFIYDDTHNILTNRHIRITAITPGSITAVFNSPSGNRPFANLTLAMNYYFHGYDLAGYHYTNLLIHTLAALLVFMVGRMTLRLCGTESTLIPLLAAALWLVNPVHTQSVTYIVQRMNSLAAMFFLLAMFCYIRARLNTMAGKGRVQRCLLYALCLMAAVLGVTSKEIAASLPVILFLYEWYFFQNLDRAWLRRQLSWIGLSVVIIGILAGLYLGASPMEKIIQAYEKHNFTPFQRLLTEPGVVLYYICLLFFPHPDRLALIYDFPVFSSVFSPLTTVIAMLGISALIFTGALLSRKQRLLSFAIFWFLINLLIESSFYGLALVFEHRTYLPSIFPFIALSAIFIKSSKTQILPVAVILSLITVCGIWTHQRNTVWNNAIHFWQDNTDKAPNDTAVHNNLGEALLVAGKTGQAEVNFKRAIAIDPNGDHFNNLGLVLMKKGDIERAISLFYQALRYKPQDANTHFNLGTACFQKQDLDCARTHLRQAAQSDPYSVLTLNNLVAVLVQQKKYEEATDTLFRLADLIPKNPQVDYNLACTYALQGEKTKAVASLKKAVEKGYDRWHYLKTDKDLENIHDTVYFKHLVR